MATRKEAVDHAYKSILEMDMTEGGAVKEAAHAILMLDQAQRCHDGA